MSLTRSKFVQQNRGMFGSELSYVRAQLGRLDTAERREVAAEIEVHPKTLSRILSRKTKFGRTDTIGKIAMYFRTKEKRRS